MIKKLDFIKNIYSNRCWFEGKLQPATVSFENGIITAIHTHKLENAEDVGDDVLMPGIIDAHVHINEPGRTEWEGFDTATLAAAAGGITTIIDMPLNASPVTVSRDAFEKKLAASENKLHVNVGFYGGLVPGNTEDLPALMEAGVLGIKCFLVHSGIDDFPNVTKKDLDVAMPVIAAYELPLLAHCEIHDEGEVDFSTHATSYKHYLNSRPRKWENDAINLMIELCRKHKCPVHIVHVSSSDALNNIDLAKKEGLPLTAETCAHYLYFNAEDIPDKNTLFKCAPPIREKENNLLLRKAFEGKVLDFIATDHSPAPPEIKELNSGNLMKAWGGIAGLQFLLPASWSSLQSSYTLESFIPLLTENPALFLKVDNRKGKIKAGFDADLVIWSPENKAVVSSADILHRHKISPYVGEELQGIIKQTWVNGIQVYKDKILINKNSGKWLLKK